MLDGRHDASALVDTGADYSIMSRKLVTHVKEVATPWYGRQIRTAGGHVVTPLGMCTTRVGIRGRTFLCSCLILPECSRDLILGVDFLREYGAIIDLRERTVTFSTERAAEKPDDRHISTFRVSADSITLPPRSSVLVDVVCDELRNGEAVAEGNLALLFSIGICAARSLVTLCDSRATLLVTNFSNEQRHLFRRTAIAFAYPIEDVAECFTATSMQSGLQSTSTDASSALGRVDINSSLSEQERTALH